MSVCRTERISGRSSSGKASRPSCGSAGSIKATLRASLSNWISYGGFLRLLRHMFGDVVVHHAFDFVYRVHLAAVGLALGQLKSLLLMKFLSKVWNGYEFYKMMAHQ